MATTVARLEAVLSADTRHFDRAMDDSGKKTGRWSAGTKLAMLGVGAAIVGLGKAVKLGFDEFAEAQRVTAQTEAVLRSTGGAANVTAGHIGDLAEALMRKSGVDDEAIQSGENMLLTFTKIRNETGKGNDIFDQATKATLNLSVAMGKDMTSSAVMVGKALNDPIKGMTAMGRAGVQFTESQKETIKALIASGDQMGAQKIILKELEVQFGGSAEAAGKTFSGQINIAKNTLLNFAGAAIAKAMPVMADLAEWLSKNLPRALRVIEKVIDEVGPFVIEMFKNMERVGRAMMEGIAKVWRENEDDLRRIWEDLKPVLNAIVTLFRTVVIPTLEFVFTEVMPRAIRVAVTAIGLLLAAVDKVRTGFIWVRDNGAPIWSGLASVGKVAWAAISLAIQGIDKAVDGMRAAFGWVREHAGAIWLGFQIAVLPAFTAIRLGVQNIDRAVDGLRAAFGWMGDHAAAIWRGVESAIDGPLGQIRAAIAGVDRATDGVRTGFVWMRDSAGGIIAGLWNKIDGPLDSIRGGFARVARSIDAIVDALKWIRDNIGGILGRVGSLLGNIPGVGGDGGIITPGTIFGAAAPPGAGTGPADISSKLWDELAIARGMGLTLISGYRRGAITSTGNPSDHGKYPSHAIDIASGSSAGWSDSRMRGYATAIAGRLGMKQIILSPYFWQPGQGWASISTPSVLRDHWNHVHAAVYDRGGTLPPGLTLALNKTGVPERVIAPGQGSGDVHLHVHGSLIADENKLLEMLQRAYQRVARTSPGPIWSR